MFRSLFNNYLNPGFWRGQWLEIQLAWRLLRDRRVPLYKKAVPLFVIVYLLSPFDLVPGFLPVIGQIDDFALLVLGLKLFIRLAPAEVVREHRERLGTPQR
jgi:uncharacterized membrane protein YkvA (DUF1232 family)